MTKSSIIYLSIFIFSSFSSYSYGNTPRVFAVIIGIADYSGYSSDLKYADDDARLFRTYLLKAMPNETSRGKVTLLLNGQATRQAVLTALSSHFRQASASDFILFYFSGHGSPGKFIPHDHSQYIISHKEIKDLFMLSKARYKICIADACFSGSILNGESSQGSFNNMMQINDANIAVIMSSKPSQTSSEQSSLKQGLFSYFLIKGLLGGGDLNRDSYVTVGELFKYTLAKTKQQSGGSQIPVILGNNLDRIPLARIKRN